MVLDFYVGEFSRDVEVTVSGTQIIDRNLDLLHGMIEEPLTQKETIKLCTKFWTGVDIL